MSYTGLYFGSYNGAWFGSVSQDEIELLGGIMTNGDIWSRAKKIERKKQKQAIDIIQEVLSDVRSHERTPKSAYYEISEKSQHNEHLKDAIKENIPHDFAYITENQLQAILQKITNEYLKLMKIVEDDEIIIALYAN
jgi:transcriptional/translational regulatory protein YebC/TACO1